jgi:DNA-binding NtrC family response regulator
LGQKYFKDKVSFIPKDLISSKYEEAISQFEKQYFKNIMEINDWNTKEAAKDAGISREWLTKKIKKHNIRNV